MDTTIAGKVIVPSTGTATAATPLSVNEQLAALSAQVQELTRLLQATGVGAQQVSALAAVDRPKVEVKSESEKWAITSKRKDSDRYWYLSALPLTKTDRGTQALLAQARLRFAGRPNTTLEEIAWARGLVKLSNATTLKGFLFGDSAVATAGRITEDQVRAQVETKSLDEYIRGAGAKLAARLGQTYEAYLRGDDIVVTG